MVAVTVLKYMAMVGLVYFHHFATSAIGAVIRAPTASIHTMLTTMPTTTTNSDLTAVVIADVVVVTVLAIADVAAKNTNAGD